jgi:adenylate cyclase
MWPVAVTVVSLAAIGVGGFLYFTRLETSAPSKIAAASNPGPAPSAVAAPPPAPAITAVAAAAPSSPTVVSSDKFAAGNIPFISDKSRAALASDYAPAGDFKAFSLNIGGFNAFVTAQPNEEAAKSAAVEQCQKRADAAQSPRKCELYAVGDTVVYAHAKPPVPPLPWIRHDAATGQPFIAKDVPLTREAGKARLENVYAPARKNKAVALGPGGALFFPIALDSVEEAVRRALESCGGIAGAPCILVALNDNFVVPVPTTRKVTGFFKAAGNTMIAADARDDVARRLAEASSGWNAVAVGAGGRPGLGLKAADEQAAVHGALADCVKRDSNCRVIAIGPFSVGPN